MCANTCNLSFYLLSGKYFDEISQDTGKYCFGVEDTFKALEMGAVEILIVWENLDVNRYVLKNHSSDGQYQGEKLRRLLPNTLKTLFNIVEAPFK